jgi:hypothetical protein
MMNRAWSPGFVEDKALESIRAYVSSQFDSLAAQVWLCDKIEVHSLLLIQMRFMDPNHFAAQEIVLWGRGAANISHQSRQNVILGWDQPPQSQS